jgi:hypothetical protein
MARGHCYRFRHTVPLCQTLMGVTAVMQCCDCCDCR